MMYEVLFSQTQVNRISRVKSVECSFKERSITNGALPGKKRKNTGL